MAVVVNAGSVTLRGIMKHVTFTNAALNREATKLAPNARSFPVQCSYDSAITLSGCIICRS